MQTSKNTCNVIDALLSPRLELVNFKIILYSLKIANTVMIELRKFNKATKSSYAKNQETICF